MSPNATMYGNQASSSRGVGLASSREKKSRADASALRRAIFAGPFFVIAIWRTLHNDADAQGEQRRQHPEPVLCASRRPWN
jgi:hypothetical protein